jgi:hypothetical protein
MKRYAQAQMGLAISNLVARTRPCGSQYHFHPANLPERSTLLPLARFESNSERLQNAQRRYSLIVHHAAWLGF